MDGCRPCTPPPQQLHADFMQPYQYQQGQTSAWPLEEKTYGNYIAHDEAMDIRMVPMDMQQCSGSPGGSEGTSIRGIENISSFPCADPGGHVYRHFHPVCVWGHVLIGKTDLPIRRLSLDTLN